MAATERQIPGILLALALAAGCTTYSEVQFAPKVQDVELRDEGTLEARVVVAWQGVHRREIEGRERWDLRFRVRIENPMATPFVLTGSEFVLLDGALAQLGTAEEESLPPLVEAGQASTFDLVFLLPEGRDPGSYDLSALNLRGSLQSGRWAWSTNFQRLDYDGYYGYPYPYPAWGVSFGVSVSS